MIIFLMGSYMVNVNAVTMQKGKVIAAFSLEILQYCCKRNIFLNEQIALVLTTAILNIDLMIIV